MRRLCGTARTFREYDHAAREIVVRPDEEQDLLTIRRASLAAVKRRARDRLRTPEVPHGSLLICGGGDLPDSVWQRLIELSGGPDAKIVFLTASLPDPDTPESQGHGYCTRMARGLSRSWGLARRRTQIHHASHRHLHNAGGVWFTGGRQWKYLDAFQGTVAEKLFRDVLARGGVIGGSSGDRRTEAEYMVRGKPAFESHHLGRGLRQGLDFLPGTAIDIHVAEPDRLESL